MFEAALERKGSEVERTLRPSLKPPLRPKAEALACESSRRG